MTNFAVPLVVHLPSLPALFSLFLLLFVAFTDDTMGEITPDGAHPGVYDDNDWQHLLQFLFSLKKET